MKDYAVIPDTVSVPQFKKQEDCQKIPCGKAEREEEIRQAATVKNMVKQGAEKEYNSADEQYFFLYITMKQGIVCFVQDDESPFLFFQIFLFLLFVILPELSS